MATNVSIDRDHTGKLHLAVAGQYAPTARVTGFQQIGEDLCAVVVIPTNGLTLGEVKNVIPFVRPEAA